MFNEDDDDAVVIVATRRTTDDNEIPRSRRTIHIHVNENELDDQFIFYISKMKVESTFFNTTMMIDKSKLSNNNNTTEFPLVIDCHGALLSIDEFRWMF
jgi:hypothetical protein